MTFENLVSRLDRARICGTSDWGTPQYKARCPAHDDRNPSLSVTTTSDGELIVHCHAGCTFESILDAAGRREQLRAQRALVLEAAYAAHPERFVRGKPTARPLHEAVWINKPVETDRNDSHSHESELVIRLRSVPTSGHGIPATTEIPVLTTSISQRTLDEAANSKARA